MSVTLDSHTSRRTVPVADLVVGPYETDIAPDELLTWLAIPVPPDGSRTGFYEIAPREGDFATVGAIWHAHAGRTRVAVFGADVGHLLVELDAGVEPGDVADHIRARRRRSTDSVPTVSGSPSPEPRRTRVDQPCRGP